MKVVINDEYKNCKELVVFLESLDTRYRQKGRTLHLDRNAVRSFAISELGRDIVIKRYKKPLSVQRVVYSFFRKSKAERAYYNGLKLLELGIDTPTPIAYVEQKKAGLMEYCYFACEKTSYKSLEPLILLDKPLDDHLAMSLARFLIDLHTKGVLHNDLNGGNILYYQDGDTNYHFSLIDNNRMEFTDKDISFRDRMENICKFSSKAIFAQIVGCYAEILGMDIQLAIEEALDAREKFFEARAKRRAFWAKFKKDEEKK
ncbi:MAG: lipopolysaccharide kinase InaA family protein [Paludibacteraceae bacterium]|nr:lipopolysaccharide kinase InaA family protein [Paludibacteraceae bacterium]